MVNVHDLMIGNWILHEEEYALVKSPSETYITIQIKGEPGWSEFSIQPSDAHPIPLTPELMVKIGWHCTENTRHKKCYKSTDKKSDLDGLVFNFGAYDFVKPKNIHYNIIAIRYLHELQNQYRWENSKPLQINLFDIK